MTSFNRAARITEASTQVTVWGLLKAVERGDREAFDTLFALVYDELGGLAHRQRLRWHGDLTVDTTVLVHEVYMKMANQAQGPARSRAHFFAVAAKAMRHVLCNYARDRSREKRGGGVPHVRLEPGDHFSADVELSDDQSDMLAALEESLGRLERIAARQARVVECRFFGGMSVADTATALGISARTVKRDWSFAQAWLRREMQRLA
jgi:RNA polymerase sigma factor (TIGR02999 family)